MLHLCRRGRALRRGMVGWGQSLRGPESQKGCHGLDTCLVVDAKDGGSRQGIGHADRRAAHRLSVFTNVVCAIASHRSDPGC
ncbi:hypothetical protein JCM9957A_58230 [Kineosporia succinea]